MFWGRRVYPRVCGGTPGGGCDVYDVIGLSPRVRGNHKTPKGLTAEQRSIPACAGEPKG